MLLTKPFGPQAPETCDDGNTIAGDGCSNVCQIEPAPLGCGSGVTT
eukprot:gene12834-biopygen8828